MVRIAQRGNRHLQLFQRVGNGRIGRFGIVHADGQHAELVVVLVLLIHGFQVGQTGPARPTPGGPKIQHHDLAGQRFGRDRLALGIEEFEVRHLAAQQLHGVGGGEELHQFGPRGRLELEGPGVDLAADLRTDELGHYRKILHLLARLLQLGAHFVGGHDHAPQHVAFLVDPEAGGPFGPLHLDPVAIVPVDLAGFAEGRRFGFAQKGLQRLIAQQQHQLRRHAAALLGEGFGEHGIRQQGLHGHLFRRLPGDHLAGQQLQEGVPLPAVANHGRPVNVRAELVGSNQGHREIDGLVLLLFVGLDDDPQGAVIGVGRRVSVGRHHPRQHVAGGLRLALANGGLLGGRGLRPASTFGNRIGATGPPRSRQSLTHTISSHQSWLDPAKVGWVERRSPPL